MQQHTNTNNSLDAVIKQSSKKKSIIFDFKKTWAAYLILIILVVVSFFVRDFVEKEAISSMQIEFDKSCSSVVTRIQSQYDRVSQVITSTQGLYYENVQVVRDYFELYGAVPTKTYSSIMSLAFAPKVLYSNWGAFHYAALSQGYWTFDLHPSGIREFYYPAEHIVDFEKNKHRLAYDYASDEIIKSAIDTSIILNKIVTTEFYNLRDDTLSFALIAPIFKKDTDTNEQGARKNNFFGSLVMEVNAEKFFKSALTSDEEKNGSLPSDTSVVFIFVDKNHKGESNNIYISENCNIISENNFQPLFSSEVPIKLANREIVAKFYSSPAFANSMQSIMPIVALVVSLLISIIAFMLIIMLLTQKARAEEVAKRMTESQRRIIDTSKDIIAAISMDGKWLSMNPASIELLGVAPHDLIGTSITNYFYNTEDVGIWSDIISGSIKDNRVDVQFKINLAGVSSTVESQNYQDYKWISWNFTVSKEENIVYAIGRDITIEKQAEKETQIRARQLTLTGAYTTESVTSKNLLITQLNHKLRNELTASMGYLQLLADKFYTSQEELDLYISSANEGFEKAFMVISDAFETTLGEDSYFDKLFAYKIEDILNLAVKNHYISKNKELEINFSDDSKNSKVIVDKDSMVEVFMNIFNIFSTKIEFDSVENLYEGVTEIMIEADSTPEVSKFIELFNKKPDDVFELLRYDVNDVLFNIAKTGSLVRSMLGNFKIENIGQDKSYIFITLPLVEKFRQEI